MVQSASGLLSLLDEPEPSVQSYALSIINSLIHSFWPEVADHVVKIESLSESPSFPSRELASLVASKVYYHLQNLDEALSFALGAGKLFSLEGEEGGEDEEEFVETVVSKAIDKYVASRSTSATDDIEPLDPRLELVVERMFERCERAGEWKHALGIALSSHRLDIIPPIISLARDPTLLSWLLRLVVREGVIDGQSRSYKNEVLTLLLKLFEEVDEPDYFSIVQCWVYLPSPRSASDLLGRLVKSGREEDHLKAYQISFDLVEMATQEFLEVVRREVRTWGEGEEWKRVDEILGGEESIKLFLEFLYRNNQADLLILNRSKEVLEPRNSIYHSALTFQNAFSNAGTTSDLFLRTNLDWLARASNWSKFSATAGLGVIHKGNLSQGRQILEPYLPKEGEAGSVYSEGGALYALGLVNANHGREEVLGYLGERLKGGRDEVIQHGAALGLGVAGMGSGNEEIYEELRNVLFVDSAIAGEAAGYAMGLIMVGTGSEKALDEMLQYAHETQHEKIIRGLAIGISFLMYGKEEEADGLIEKLLGDADAILRYGGIYTIAMAYAGTGNNKAIRKLLHVAVSDVNDDVRRAAVTGLGFILFRNPTQVPRIVQLLSESYNPNVRYGAALALGISCAGTGLEDAIALLEPLTKDPVDFVRQGACLSLAMVLVQQNEATNPKVTSVRQIFTKIVGDKHEDAMAKFGAALSQGIIDAGGRNVTISLQNRSGAASMPAVVGMALFTQFWYWFPTAHLLSLTFVPTAVIGVDKDLKLPKFEFLSNVKPSLFAYPPATKPPQKLEVEKVATAVLSTTAKAEARVKKAKEAAASDGMDTDDKPSEPKVSETTSTEDAEMKTAELSESSTTITPTLTKPKRKAEPTFSHLSNLSRVTPAQLAFITFSPTGRYLPVRLPSTAAGGGILLMQDREPEKEAEFIELEVTKVLEDEVAGTGAGAGAATTTEADQALLEGEIAAIPEPFEYEHFD